MRRVPAASSAFFLLLVLARAAHAETELKNDGFATGMSAGFQAGFTAGEIGAVTLVDPAGGGRLTGVRLIFGGGGTPQDVTLHVWDDATAGMIPGGQIYEGDFHLVASNDSFQDLDLSMENVFVPARFRIGIEFQHSGAPSIARDDDGTLAADKNYICADLGTGSCTWFRSQAFGLTGDWIIRGLMASTGTPDAGTGGPDAGTGGPDAGTGGPDAGTTGGTCNGNGDCEVGEYCDTAVHACTFDCRHDTDCPGDDQCNSLGQCVGATDGGGGGCCSTGSEGNGALGALGALGLAGIVGLLVARRRRTDDARAPR